MQWLFFRGFYMERLRETTLACVVNSEESAVRIVRGTSNEEQTITLKLMTNRLVQYEHAYHWNAPGENINSLHFK